MSGFQTSREQSQADTVGKVFTYAVDAAHASRLSPGDAVVVTGEGTALGVQEVDTAPTGTAGTGIIQFVDVKIAGETLSDTGLAAGVAGTVKVQVSDSMLFEAEVSNGPLVAANVGLNAPLVNTAATLLGGLTVSNMGINATGIATTQALPFQIVGLLKGETSGVLGDRALVRPNATTTSDGTAGI